LSTRALLKALGALFTIGLLAGPTVAWAAPGSNNPSADRAKVRAQRAKVAADVNALKATDAQVDAALRALNANVSGQEALYSEAQRASNQADQAEAAANAAVAAKQAQIDQLKAQIRKFAVEAFVHPPGDDALQAMDEADPGKAAEKRALLELQNTNDQDLLDQLTAAEQDLDVERRLAHDAAERAKAKKADVANRLGSLKSARDAKAAFAGQVQDRLDQALGEAASLASLDASLSRQIEQQELARASAAGVGNGGRGGGPVGNVNLGSASCPSGGRITVAASIAGSLQRMLDAAYGDGVSLCGGGYRSSADQVATRKANGCPDVYTSPPSSCHPPTARPGTSNHERGLAVDFTCNGGGVISSRSSPCFVWLKGHAASYGFYNLPSEPWHWSTNGD
jgi:peptidoglycan hydrolase CwlO-like protein